LPESTSNENKLILYGLYKQATVGDVNTGMYTEYLVLFSCYFCFARHVLDV
jgi:acyl-CoA-binding protein